MNKKINSIYLGLGSNLGDRIENLNTSIEFLVQDRNISLISKSNIYETQAMYNINQPPFLNMVIELKSEIDVDDFFIYIQNIEKLMGRKFPRVKNSARIIDIDILIFKNMDINNTNLIIPHKDLINRAFDIIPLNDLSPNLIIPRINKSVGEIMLLLDYNDDIIKLYKTNI